MKILYEDDTLVFGREKDQLRDVGILMTIAMLSARHSKEQAFNLFERLEAAVVAHSYGVLYERANREASALLPVAYTVYAKLSKPVGVIFSENLRTLRPSELNSGPDLWVLDVVAPLGHSKEIADIFFGLHKDYPTYYAMKPRTNGWRKEVHKNPQHVTKEE
jgi:hemolysin-activating ACP:hemolysin acyltransferase